MQNKRILMVANTASMIKLFNLENIKILQSLGYQVFVAANFTIPGTITKKAADQFRAQLTNLEVRSFDIKFKRGVGNPIANHQIFKQLCQIVATYQIGAIHTHAPLSSVICRRVARKMKIKCIYTSHGFQFFSGGPIRNWLLFYPLEWYYAHWTDALITINQDDYHLAVNHLPAKKVYYIPGIGTNIAQNLNLSANFRRQHRQLTRQKLGIAPNDFMILSVGELSQRKNHATVLKAIAKLHNPKIKYFIAGIGPEKNRLLALAKQLNISNQLYLLGFCNNARDLYLAADLNAFISQREGLGLAGLDGVALGVYIVASAATGAKDYVKNKQTGHLIHHPLDVNEVTQAIYWAYQHHPSPQPNSALLKFDQEHINHLMIKIYRQILT